MVVLPHCLVVCLLVSFIWPLNAKTKKCRETKFGMNFFRIGVIGVSINFQFEWSEGQGQGWTLVE